LKTKNKYSNVIVKASDCCVMTSEQHFSYFVAITRYIVMMIPALYRSTWRYAY